MIRVALVEDDMPFRETLESYLNQSPAFRCVSAYAHPRDALRGLLKDPPDVVLMDLQMPGMSGIECIIALRQELPSMRVILLTVSEQDENIFKAGSWCLWLLGETHVPAEDS